MDKIAPPPPHRLASLDVLRAVAVLLVVGCHMPEMATTGAPAPILSFLHTWQRGGWIGVDLFFVLSGFLISGLLFREYQSFGSIRYGHFLARRGFKIYPAFYIMVGLVLWFAGAHGRPFVGWPVLGSELLFVQNYGPSLFPHTWSLAVEEHFYLLLPLLLLGLRGRTGTPFAALPRVVGVVAGAVLAARFLNPSDQALWLKTHVFPTHLRIDSLLFGVLLAWGFHFHHEVLMGFVRKWRTPLAVLATILVVPPFVFTLGTGWYLHTLGLTANYVAGGACLLLALHLQPSWRPLAFIGRHSYSIYLWHIPVRFFGLAWIPRDWPPLVSLLIYFALSIALGFVAAKIVETPFLALRDRLFPTRSQIPGAKLERKPVQAEGGDAVLARI
jgi:peptidoglycan/LPS O-acetylase OafA/YrhL